MSIESLMWLFPIVFMVHEFEEIIFLPLWIKDNASYITNKYPILSKKIGTKLMNISTESFALAVLEEFLILSILTYLCVEYKYYSFFAVLIVTYFFHVLVHIVQSIALKKYIPAVGSGVITGIYNIYSLYTLNFLGYLDWEYIGEMTLPVIIVMVLNLVFIHWLTDKFRVLISAAR
ncbi:MAG: hypothetical protein H6Q73_1026 [Firmicutes bacterium]|nr:hypothetical protein [Bacillota bacterium]